MKYCFYIFLFTLSIYSCKSDAQRSEIADEKVEIINESNAFVNDYFNKIFIPESDKVFRNVNFDESFEVIKSTESKGDLSLSEESKGYLQYEKDIHIDTANGIDYVMVKYIFDSNEKLWVITVNYIIQDSIKINTLYDNLNTTFSDKYGDYYFDRDGFTVWESSYKRNDSIDVIYDLGVRKLLKFDDPGIQIELMRFGQL